MPTLDWTPRPAWSFALDARHTSEVFEDDENQLALAAAITADFAVTHRFSPRTEVFAAVQNLFNATVETGRSADGVTNIAPARAARTARTGVRLALVGFAFVKTTAVETLPTTGDIDSTDSGEC